MPNPIFDDAIELQLDLARTSSSIERDVLVLLVALQKELVAKIAAGEFTAASRARIDRQLSETTKLISGYYGKASSLIAEATPAIAEVAARATAQSLSVAVTAAMPSTAVLETIASQSMIQGAAQGAWWAKQSTDTAFKFGQAVRRGLASSETNGQIIGRVRGFMDVSRRSAAALVQTSVATVANNSRAAVYAANDDIIKKYRAVATLDSHTCLTCAPLDGLEWHKDGGAIGHKFSFPQYPLHFNCRCLTIPVVFDGPQGGKRASSDGPIAASDTFTDWLSRQPPAKVEDILGKGRAELYRSGKLTLTDLVSGRGKPLSLTQLQNKYA